MTVDLKWNDAVGVALNAFTDEERKSGWPSEMLPHQLTALQRPFVHTDPVSIRRLESLHEALERSCKLEVLPCRKEVEIKTWTEYVPKEYTDHSELVSRTETYQEPHQRSQESTFYWVKPNDFAAWLRTQGEEPSPHIANWFMAQGVASNVRELASVPVADVAKPVESPPKPPKTWAELVQYHKANPGHWWTVELKNIVATERGRRGDQTGAAVAMGAELGFKGAERVNSLVRTKDQHGKRKAIVHQRTGTR